MAWFDHQGCSLHYAEYGHGTPLILVDVRGHGRSDKTRERYSIQVVGWGVQERLSKITCPTLVISADHDDTSVAQKQIYVKLLPDARLAVIENSRHATPLDQPEVFNATLLDFLKTVETTTQDH
ncbi:alpha/beta fold hydrolase [Pseudomonas sp. ICMP 460]|uniref:alpha/beta fold hydrolase n=1 Tax=Pseudomonas sp. ICMP 460 TaxID=1718917 RepID=UPI000C072F86|nr:alpha/beta hydrolase [Pseudomonas sp. ICMP 460]PHN18437.1 hypothetical protein AO240_23165 [Pseudomonas sp. ICMP 460]